MVDKSTPRHKISGEQLRFYENHRYQFLIIYMIRFLDVAVGQQQKQDTPKKSIKRQVKDWAYYDLAFNRTLRDFFTGTILEVAPTTLLSVNFFKNVGLKKDLDKIDIDTFFDYLEYGHPLITDKYVIDMMAYIQQRVRENPSPYWMNVWIECMEHIAAHCGKRPDTVSVHEQIAMMINYSEYMECVKDMGPEYAMSIMSQKRGWPIHSKEEEQLSVLDSFFDEAEEAFGEFGFKRKEFVDYVLRNLRLKQKNERSS